MELTNAEATKYQRRNDIRDIDSRLRPSLTSDHLFDSMAIHSEPKTASARSRQLQIEGLVQIKNRQSTSKKSSDLLSPIKRNKAMNKVLEFYIDIQDEHIGKHNPHPSKE